MPSLNVRDLPDSVHNALKEAAHAEGRSLNGYVVALLKASTEECERRKLMRENRAEFRAYLASLPKMDDSTPLICEDRERGH